MRTKAVRMYGAMDLRLEEFELPQLGEKEVLMKVAGEYAKITLDSPGMEMSGRFYGTSSPCPAGGGHTFFDVTKVEGYRIHDETATYQVESRLKAGDLVLLIPDRERQIYYLIMKVVSHGAVSAD